MDPRNISRSGMALSNLSNSAKARCQVNDKFVIPVINAQTCHCLKDKLEDAHQTPENSRDNETTLPLKRCQTRPWIHGELFQSSPCLGERQPPFSGGSKTDPPLYSKILGLNAYLQSLSPPVPGSGWIVLHGRWILWRWHTLWIERRCPSRLQTWERGYVK